MPPANANRDAARLLGANDALYRRLRREVERLHARGDAGLLPFIESVAAFAWGSHPGRLADGALDNILLKAGRRLGNAPVAEPVSPRAALPASRTLHVASELHVTGGHTRVLAKWIERDLSSAHTIVVTRQQGELPPFLAAVAAERGAEITLLDPSQSIEERVRRLRGLSWDQSRVILHHHPNDAVPVLAYAQPGGPPVAMFNHAHFWFSLGSGVADLTINTMPYFRRLTEQHRFPAATELLHGPFGLDRLQWSEIDKWDAKQRLGLLPDRPVAITVGAEVYFTPVGDIDFFATLTRLLNTRPELQVLVVGVRDDSPLVPPSLRAMEQVRLVGPVADPRPYYEAADLCLESFPMPSLGALSEAVAYGEAFPVPAFAEAESPLRVNQQRIAAIAVRQPTEHDYLAYVGDLLDASQATRGAARGLRHRLIKDDEGFGDQFASLYGRLDRLEHRPRELPRTACAAAPENLALASSSDPAGLASARDALPLRSALAAHLHAVVANDESPRAAVLALARRLARPLFGRLPAALRRRLRSG